MAILPLEPVPWRDPTLVGKPWTFAQNWLIWFDSLRSSILARPAIVGSSTLTGQSAALAPTTVATVPQDGTYRVTVASRVTTPDSVASVLQVTIRWTAGGAAQSLQGALQTGNTTTTQETLAVVLDADAGTTITVETGYSSSLTEMRYRLAAVVEQLT